MLRDSTACLYLADLVNENYNFGGVLYNLPPEIYKRPKPRFSQLSLLSHNDLSSCGTRGKYRGVLGGEPSGGLTVILKHILSLKLSRIIVYRPMSLMAGPCTYLFLDNSVLLPGLRLFQGSWPCTIQCKLKWVLTRPILFVWPIRL